MNDLENFRVEVKDWLDKNCPSTMRAGAPADTPIDAVSYTHLRAHET